jgi:hypothetical protein
MAQLAAETGNPDALNQLARLLEETGHSEEARRLRQYGLKPGGDITHH